MSVNERIGFERILASHTAPTLLGIKCANLISVPVCEKEILRFGKELKHRCGLDMKTLCRCHDRQLLYIFHEKLLEKQLCNCDIKKFLSENGYSENMTLPEMLDHLAVRIKNGDFPHEIGIFLGYPLADVTGFIENHGKNCLLCGCWKVYSDPESARQKFAKYGRCRDILCDKLDRGFEFYRALELSQEEIS